MSALQISILLLAAWLHASWNFRLKRCPQPTLVFWWALALSSLILLPSLAWVGLPGPQIWPLLLASAVLQALYLGVLGRAYRVADFSLVYPMARGTAPLFLLLISTFGLQQQLALRGQLGVLILTFGLVALGYTSERKGLGLALAIAAIISCYTALDSQAVRQTSALSYLVTQWTLSCLIAFPAVVGRGLSWDQWREHWRDATYIGLASAAAYGLALWVYQQAPVAYAGAVREVSVVMAAWMGARWGGERLGWRRVLACLVITTGILLMAGV